MNMTATRRLAAISALVVTASTLLFTGSASAASEQRCNNYFCNKTVGVGNYVQYVDAGRKSALGNKYGFFEVYGRGWKKTGPSSTHGEQIPISRTVSSGELVCLRFFENVAGQWIERGAAVCTSAPIG
jgi:hypothetical protein